MPKITKLKRCPLCNDTDTEADFAGYEGTLRKICIDRWCNSCGASWADNFEYADSSNLLEGTNGAEAEFPPDRIMP